MTTAGYIDTYYARTLRGEEDYFALSGVEEADVCVIGGGLAGLNTALGLLERGKKVALIEQHRLGWGASGRNAGFVAKGYAAGEASLTKKLGLYRAQQLVSLTKNARKMIKKRIAELDIDCGPVIDGVLTVSWQDNPDAVRRYIDQANSDFDLGFEFWDRGRVREQCKTQRYFDGVFSPNDYQFNPLRYVQGLAQAVIKKGGKIFENSPAVKTYREGKTWVTETPNGKIKSEHVVLCCAIYSKGLDRRLETSIIPVQTYITVTKPIDEKLLKESINTRYAIYDMRFCSDYYRVLPDNRVLWGGRVGLFAHPTDIAKELIEDMFKVYPQLRGHVEPEVSWAGELAYATHKMPQIGKMEDGYWYNTGFGGHGLCPTTAGGEVVAAAIAEGDTTYQQFQPFTVSPYGLSFAGGRLGRYVAQGVYLTWRMRDWFKT